MLVMNSFADGPAAPQGTKNVLKRVCEIWRKTDPEADGAKGQVSDGERQFLVEALDCRTCASGCPNDSRRMAAVALGNLRAKEAVAKLLERLTDGDEYHMVSVEAANALGKIGDARAAPHLIQALKSDRTLVRPMAGRNLALVLPQIKDTKGLVSRKLFRELLDSLAGIRLPKSQSAWNLPTEDPMKHYATQITAPHLDALCRALLLCDAAVLREEDKRRASELAGKIINSGFPSEQYRSFGSLCRFCALYGQDKGRSDGEKAKRSVLLKDD